jgi:hypothetical protein
LKKPRRHLPTTTRAVTRRLRVTMAMTTKGKRRKMERPRRRRSSCS